MIHISINRSAHTHAAFLHAVNAASRLRLFKNYVFHVIEYSKAVNKRSFIKSENEG